MSSSTQPISAQPGDAASSTPETAPEGLTPSACASPTAPDAAAQAPAPSPSDSNADSAAGPAGDAIASDGSPWADTVAADPAEQAGQSSAAPSSADEGKPAGESAGKAPDKGADKGLGKTAQDGGRVDVPAVAAALKDLFPALFSGAAKPVKLRIQADIQERAPGKFSKQQLSAFLRRYTGGTGYLIGLTKAKHRFDLDGQPAGEISEEHRQAAQEELTRRRGITETRRADEERGRIERAQLLRDFSRTTLTPANFCALKGLTQEQLDAQLALAREEEAQQPARPPRDDRGDRRPNGPGRPGGGRGGERQGERRGERPAGGGERRAEGGQRPPRGEGRPRGDGPQRPDGGKRPPRRSNG